MRKSDVFLMFSPSISFSFFLMFTHASLKKKTDIGSLKEKIEVVKRLELTDLCLFTEANYTRHLSRPICTPRSGLSYVIRTFSIRITCGPPRA